MIRSRLRWFGCEAGFTLIELLVVTTIILVLAVLAIPVYASSADKTRHTKSLEDLRVIEQALETYHANTGHYPDSLLRLIEGGYLKDTTPNHDSLKSPWYTEKNPVWYFYAVDLPDADTAQAFALGDRGPGGETCRKGGGISLTAALYTDTRIPIPCGRNPATDPGAYVFAGLSATLAVYDGENNQIVFPYPPDPGTPPTLRGRRPSDLRTE